MKLVQRNPQVGYLDTHLWLPKTHISERQIRGSLSYDLGKDKAPIEAWDVERYHFRVPRNYMTPGLYPKLSFPIFDTRFTGFPAIDIRSHAVMDSRRPELTVQRDAAAALLRTHDGILCLRCGAGKALQNEEPVLTTEGWIPIGNITVNHRVIGSDGKAYPVIGVFPQGRRKLYDITFADGTVIKADASHLWEVYCQRALYTEGEPRLRTTEQLLEEGLVFKGGQYKHFIKLGSPVPGTKQQLPLEPYLLGVLLGDGGLNHRVHLTTDTEILDNLVLPLNCEIRNRVSISPDVEEADICGTENQKNPLRAILDKLDLRCLSPQKHIPAIYRSSSLAQRLALLQGLLDTDGSAMPGLAEFSTTSETLMDQVQELVQSLGGVATKKKRQTYYSYKGEKRAGLPSFRSFIRLPQGTQPFRLKRKATNYGTRSRAVTRSIRSITPSGMGEATCISVASPDRLFRTRGHVLTHNTVVSIHAACQLKVPFLVMVTDLGLAEQWTEELLEFTDLHPEDIGFIGGGELNWKKPVCIALIQSLAGKIRRGTFPLEIVKHFGLIIGDEGHSLAAPFFVSSIPPFHGRRWALSATPYRTDIFDSLLRYTFGEIVYSYLEPELIPTVYFRKLGTRVSLRDPVVREAVTDKTGALHLQRLYGHLATVEPRTQIIAKEIAEAIKQGRQVLVLTQSRAMVEALGAWFPSAGICHGGVTDRKERLRRIRECNPVIAISRLGKQALNKPKLDTLFVCEPFTQMGVLQQLMGRVLRLYDGKQLPMVVFYDDVNLEDPHRMCLKIRTLLTRWPKNMGGRIGFFNTTTPEEHGSKKATKGITRRLGNL